MYFKICHVLRHAISHQVLMLCVVLILHTISKGIMFLLCVCPQDTEHEDDFIDIILQRGGKTQ